MRARDRYILAIVACAIVLAAGVYWQELSERRPNNSSSNHVSEGGVTSERRLLSYQAYKATGIPEIPARPDETVPDIIRASGRLLDQEDIRSGSAETENIIIVEATDMDEE